MPLIYTFPTNFELDVVVQEYMVQHEMFLGEEILPFEEMDSQKVRWDEEDNESGMTPPHNMDSEPRIDERPGSKTREYEPIPFKGSELIKESELLRARELGTLGGVINLDRYVAKRTRARQDKTYIRAEWCRWQALCNGEININENGVVVRETFPIQVYDALQPWDNHGAATPLKDANAVDLLFRGTGATARGAIEYMNKTTFNHLIENTNDQDIRGFRSQNFADVTFDLVNINKMLEARGLPMIKVYDDGYYDRNKLFQTFIPNGKSVVVGKRPMNQKVGAFGMTPTMHRSKNGVPAAGFFTFVEVNGQSNNGSSVVSTDALGSAANPNLKITGGVYGGPLFRFGRSVIRKNLY
ncbi:MAG: major capsid protein [Pyrinomonadaceae bacterium]